MITRLYMIPPSGLRNDSEETRKQAIRRNLQTREFDSIMIVGERHAEDAVDDGVLGWLPTEPNQDPTVDFLVNEINRQVTSPDDLSIICEAGTYFDTTFRELKVFGLEGICAALSACGTAAEKQAAHPSRIAAWIFQGRIRSLLEGSFSWIGADSTRRLLWQLRHADYHVCNLSRSIHCFAAHPQADNASITATARMFPRLSTLADCGIRRKAPSRTGVIAFSLFGAKPKYCVGAVENAKLAKWLYPGWTVRFYVDSSVPGEAVRQLESLHAEIVGMPDGARREGMFWRFLVADDLGFPRWIVRDVDSRLTYRERRAVDEWLDSARPYHVLRDHPAHRNPIMACGFGSIRGALPNMAELIREWREAGRPYGQYADDERFLAHMIWPRVKDTALIHDSHARSFTENIRPFPTEFETYRFVGERIFQDEHCAHNDREMLIQSQIRREHIDLSQHHRPKSTASIID